MRAEVGDELIIEGHRVGEPRRTGIVEETRGQNGGPPYRVLWNDTGRSTLMFPGSDCHIEHRGETNSEETS